MKSFYITTAIDYANGSPHIGHAYEKVLTDVIARYNRLKGKDVYFVTGLDEHGQKVQQTAEKRGVTPQELCDGVAEEYKALCGRLDITYDDYIRTTERRHKDVVNKILLNLFEKGEIYKSEYKGYYSTKEEQFLQEKDKVDGKWPESYGEVTEISESNYFFNLSQYQDWLIDHIQKNEDFIFPKYRAKQVLEFLKEPINDLCISRPKERLQWGISLPFDDDYVSYVWFDALINYISAVGYGTDEFEKYWPADYHVIGKDILVPPHAVYWPIMLKAMDIPLPKSFIVHGWWLASGSKMSKSTGNVIDPLELIEAFGADAFRYFLIREMNVGQDSDFSIALFTSRYNSDLGNDLGNLLSRFMNMTTRYCEGKVPSAQLEEKPEEALKTLWASTKKEALELFDTFQFHKAIEQIFMFIRATNRYVEIRAPWKLAKSESMEDQSRLLTSLATVGEALRLASIILKPIIPRTSRRILEALGTQDIKTFDNHLEWSEVLTGKTIGEKEILFPRIDLE
ncbi:MAG: methionine--tRNA ligase [Verrucomicrobia bacterium CG_4_10_14_0_8_um_filter_43_34]|nr:MAG: methionine--tRNA ligase [Verrucomicrobia bacterium CG_4_10_14_0_8_um_filter_43_34]